MPPFHSHPQVDTIIQIWVRRPSRSSGRGSTTSRDLTWRSLGRITVVTGARDRGNQRCYKEAIFCGLRRHLNASKDRVGTHDAIKGWEHLERVLEVDHSPIGRAPRFTPATYVGLFNEVRRLFLLAPEARSRGGTYLCPGRPLGGHTTAGAIIYRPVSRRLCVSPRDLNLTKRSLSIGLQTSDPALPMDGWRPTSRTDLTYPLPSP